MKYLETKHERNSAKITTLLLLILLMLLFVVGPPYMETPTEYGVAINFGGANTVSDDVSEDIPSNSEALTEEDEVEEEELEEEVAEEIVEEDVAEELADKVVEEETIEETTEEEQVEETEKEEVDEKVLTQELEEALKIKEAKEAKEKADKEAKEKSEKEAKEAKEKADNDAKIKAENEAKAKASKLAAEAKRKAAKAKADAEAKAAAKAAAARKAESDRKAKAAAAAAAAKSKGGSGSDEVSFALIEEVPVYPGCEGGTNAAKKKCMSTKLKQFVGGKFDKELASDLGLTGEQSIKIYFKINSKGDIVEIRAKASRPELAAEAKRISKLIPKMKPGKQQGKAVTVKYYLPLKIQTGN